MKRLLLVVALFASMNAIALEKDKQKHIGVSAVIGVTSQYYFDSYAKSALTCMSVGVAKELYDEADYSGFSKEDLLADAVGCAIGISGMKIIQVYQDDDALGLGVSFKF